MDWQTLFNIAAGAIGIIGGFLLRIIWDEVKTLHATDSVIARDIAQLQSLVAGNFVSKQEFERVLDRVFVRLDKIVDLLGEKADRHEQR